MSPFERVARFAAARPVAVLAVVGLLAVAGGLLALRLEPAAGTDTLVGRSSETFRATDDYHRRFGDDAVVILVRQHVKDLVDSADLGRLIELEYCLVGQTPPGFPRVFGSDSPCDQLGRSQAVKVVYGPGTFLKKAVDEVTAGLKARLQQIQVQVQQAQTDAAAGARRQGKSRAEQAAAARLAANQVEQQATSNLQRLAVQTGLTSVPRIDDAAFVNRVVFDPLRGTDVPKGRFSYLFPTPDASVVQVRLQPGLSDAARARAIGLIRQALTMPDVRTGRPAFLSQLGGSYTVTGVPVVVAGLAHSITRAIVTLLIAALLLMAGTLALVFRVRLRLLPLLIALAAAGLTFGAMAIAGASLTMASIAVLPVLIGLAVDYAIQLQTRVREAEEEDGPGPEAVARAARFGAPTIATAALATGVGFLVLLLSPVPMVRGFGVLLVLGIVLAFGCALTAGSALLAVTGGHASPRGLGAAARGAGELVGEAKATLVAIAPRSTRAQAAGARVADWVSGTLGAARRHPERVLAIGLGLAVLGWVADTQTRVVSDIQKLVPPDLTEIRDLNTLQKVTGVSGEVDVTVRARDLTDPGVISWMTGYQQGLLARYGYRENEGCQRATLCPALSLPDLFRSSAGAPSAAPVKALLDAVPPYFSQAVITPDRREANLAFGIRLLPLSDQQKVFSEMRRRLRDAPPGVTARLAGLPVLAAEANDKLASPWRRLGTLVAGLLAVGLALFAVFRRVERALLPLLPIALATGWSALVLFLTRIPLNPMSATLGALVIAISTEFSVLLCERYRQERAAGHDEAEALERTYRSTGRAVLASGVTAIVGFGVLGLSSIAMLRDFGLVTVVDLTASLLGVLLVLPAVLALAERGELQAGPRRALSALAALGPRLRRGRDPGAEAA